MTSFLKSVSRVTHGSYAVLYAGKPLAVVVTLKTLNGQDYIEFRHKGTRSRWLLSVEGAFRTAVHNTALRARLEKARAKKAEKEFKRRFKTGKVTQK